MEFTLYCCLWLGPRDWTRVIWLAWQAPLPRSRLTSSECFSFKKQHTFFAPSQRRKKKIQRMFLNILRFHAFQSKCNTVHLDERRGKDKLKQWQRDQCKKACLPGVGYSHANGRHQKGLWEAKLIKVVFSKATHKVSGDVLDPNLPFSGTAMVRFTARKISVLTYSPMDYHSMQLSTVGKINGPFVPVLEKVASVTLRQGPIRVIWGYQSS